MQTFGLIYAINMSLIDRHMKTAAAARIAMLTDVEGNWQYMRNVARQSSWLCLTSSGQDETLKLRDDCMLVFRGDAGDKGDDTLKCYEQLHSMAKEVLEGPM
ncbi:unnamed protein product [Peronospora destructor]|uniref:Uncharacterized protein n=1 Tax=Peronospora destructor TaxID=86335 RepID=A0AAV0UQQ9_9STRA|nr:unnamed protein product [Peronospora destructor]